MSDNFRLELKDGAPPVLHAAPMAAGDLASGSAWLREHCETIRGLIQQHSHLLVRGLPIRDAHAFSSLRNGLIGIPARNAEKTAPRTHFVDEVYSSTDLPAGHTLGMHNENSYCLEFPGMIAFACLVAPETGGETSVADGREIQRMIPPELLDRFRRLGWMLTRNFHPGIGLSWSDAFGGSTRDELEVYCKDNAIGLHWIQGDRLRATQRRSALVHHPETGREVWFNHITFWNRWFLEDEIRDVLLDSYGDDGLPFETTFGDGTPITREEAGVLRHAYDTSKRRTPYQVGDVLLVDNLLAVHGREPYRGPRQVVVSMGIPLHLHDCRPTAPPGPFALPTVNSATA